MPESEIVGKLSTEGAEEFASSMKDAAKATGEVGTEAERTSKKTKGGAKSLVKWAASAAVTYKAAGFFKDSAKAAAGLAKGTAALSRTTGQDTEIASAWVSMAKERGISVNTLQKGFTTFGKVISSATAGSKPTIKMFKDLGLSVDQLNKANTEEKIRLTADALAKIDDPLKRAATGQKLFGKSWIQLQPLLAKGSEGLKAQEKAMRDSGNTMDKEGVDKTLKMVKAQRAWKRQLEGLKITIGNIVMPVIIQLGTAITKVLDRLKPLLDFVERNADTVTKFAGALLLVVSGLKLITGAAKAFQVVQMAIKSTSITIWVIRGIALVIAGLITLYQKWDWFHNAVDATWGAIVAGASWVWNWIKQHWSQLAAILFGPFGIAVKVIVTHWDQIKAGAKACVDFIKRVFHGLVDYFKNIGSSIADTMTKAFDTVKSGASSAASTAKDVGSKSLIDVVKGRQYGGIVQPGEITLVGERGPELLSLPSGTQVTPLGPSLAASGAGAGGGTFVTKVFLDKRQIATAVAEVNADRKARR